MEKHKNPKFDNRPIGVFDSGLGGLTVVAAMRKAMPSEDIIYLGDTARVPYGNRSVETIREFAAQDLNFLAEKGVKMVLAACNTVSSVAMESMREQMPGLPVLGVIESGVDSVIRSGGQHIAVLGTRATINSDAYRRAIHAADPSLIVKSIACPLFVPLAEEGIIEGKMLDCAFDYYLASLHENPPQILLLGCTHYPLFIDALKTYLPSGVRIIDSAAAAAEYMARYLAENSISASPGKTGENHFYVTDFSGNFQLQAQRFLGWEVKHAEKVNL